MEVTAANEPTGSWRLEHPVIREEERDRSRSLAHGKIDFPVVRLQLEPPPLLAHMEAEVAGDDASRREAQPLLDAPGPDRDAVIVAGYGDAEALEGWAE